MNRPVAALSGQTQAVWLAVLLFNKVHLAKLASLASYLFHGRHRVIPEREW